MANITLTISNRFVSVDGADLKTLRALDRACSYRVAGYFFSPAYKSRRWDGKEHLFKFTRKKGYHAPAGMAEEIARILKKRKLDYVVKSETALRSKRQRFAWNPDVVLRDYQREAVRAILSGPVRGRGVLKMPIRSGKALEENEPVLTPTGWKPIGRLRAGDKVIGSDGAAIEVTGTFPQGEKELYKVTFDDGSWSVCCADHLWTFDVLGRDKSADGAQPWVRRKQTRPLKEWMQRKHYNRLRLPTVEVQGEERHLLVDPYTLGVLLGNGHLKGTPTVTLNAEDAEEVAARMAHAGTTLTRDATDRPGCVVYRFTGKCGAPNALAGALRTLNLWESLSREKHIPDEYLGASLKQRLALLAGLLDTDGSAQRAGACFHTSSKRLAHDVLALARSVGCRASLGQDKREDGCWRVIMRHTSERLFRVRRKLAAQSEPQKRVTVDKYVKSIEPCGRGHAVCISVDAEDGLFVTRGYTLTHNTKTVARVLHALGRSSLFVVPSKWLLHQTIKSLQECMPDAPVGQIGDGVFDVQFFTVATIQSLAGMAPVRATAKRKGRPAHPAYADLMSRFDVGVFDECFVAGTLVDGRKIETISVGDYVSSFDENMNVKTRRVTHVFKNRAPSKLLVVTLENGRSVVCTSGHPFRTQQGWRPAGELGSSDVVFTIEAGNDQIREMPCVRCEAGHVQLGLESNRPIQEDEKGVLLAEVRARVQGEDLGWQSALEIEEDETGVIKQDEAIESNVGCSCEGTNVGDSSRHRAPAKGARRERTADTCACSSAGFSTGMEARTCRRNGTGRTHEGTGDELQARHCERRAEDRDRDRRPVTLLSEETGAGSKEAARLGSSRVASVEVLEQGGDGRFEALCPDGFVYNLEVEETETYVANGIAVHNCHHIRGDGDWYRVFVDLDARIKIGVSATVFFENTKEQESGIIWLRATCGPIRYEVSASRLIQEGYLLPQTVIMHRIAKPKGLRDARYSATLKRECITENKYRNAKIARIVQGYVDTDKPRKTIVIAHELAHIAGICEQLDELGVGFRVLTGKVPHDKRMDYVDEFTDGDLHVLVGNVLGEGVDIPGAEIVVNAEGGQDEKQTWQRQRNLTVVEGAKKAPIMIDFYDEMSPVFERHSKRRLKVYRSEPEFSAEVL